MKKIIGYIGLGKMGRNMVYNLKDHGWKVIAFNRSAGPRKAVQKSGVATVDSIQKLCVSLQTPRIVWIMISHEASNTIIQEVLKNLQKGDTIIDGGNSFYVNSIKNAMMCKRKGVHFLDVGVSGGPKGAREGACCMIGGEKKVFQKHENIFSDISAKGGYGHMGVSGSGHFVKMVHNGIEYGMMQAIGEGFEVLKKSRFNLDLEKIADVYNHQSVITSRLVGWLKSAYDIYGVDLKKISGRVAHSGEGQWTIQTAKKLKIPLPVIRAAFEFRKRSQKKSSYTGQVVSALRNQFGGHEVKRKK